MIQQEQAHGFNTTGNGDNNDYWQTLEGYYYNNNNTGSYTNNHHSSSVPTDVQGTIGYPCLMANLLLAKPRCSFHKREYYLGTKLCFKTS
jgi:hypothetical protein